MHNLHNKKRNLTRMSLSISYFFLFCFNANVRQVVQRQLFSDNLPAIFVSSGRIIICKVFSPINPCRDFLIPLERSS